MNRHRLLTHLQVVQCRKGAAAWLLRLHHKGQCSFSCTMGHMLWYPWVTKYEVQIPWSNHGVRKLRPCVHAPVGSPNWALSQLPAKPASQVSEPPWTSNPSVQSVHTIIWLQLIYNVTAWQTPSENCLGKLFWVPDPPKDYWNKNCFYSLS